MENKKWLRPLIIVAVVAVLALVGFVGIWVLQSMFPVAPPVECPNVEEIISASAGQNYDADVAVGMAEIQVWLDHIREAEPTREWSVNDYPAVKSYYTIQIQARDRSYHYYIYTENGQVYVEAPYTGIYRGDQALLVAVAEYVNGETTQ